MARVELTKDVVEKANQASFRRHPERKGRPLTNNIEDAALGAEWLRLYKLFGGKAALLIPGVYILSSIPTCGDVA